MSVALAVAEEPVGPRSLCQQVAPLRPESCGKAFTTLPMMVRLEVHMPPVDPHPLRIPRGYVLGFGLKSSPLIGRCTHMRRLLALVSLSLVFAVGCAPLPGPGPAGAGGATGWVGDMLVRINAERANAGAAPVQLCGTLMTAAQGHSWDQAAHSNMSHTGSNGSSMQQRVAAANYVGWNALAENVAAGQPTVGSVMDAWMASAGHRRNLLSTSYTHVGLGLASSGSGTPYWTQNFGRGGSC